MLRPGPFPDTRPSLIGALQRTKVAGIDWRRFFESYAPSVFRVARRRGLTTHDADDVVQQVMVAVSAHIHKFDPETYRCRFRHWIRLITNNKVTDVIRRQAVRPEVALTPDNEVTADDLDRIWEEEWYRHDIRHCLEQVRFEISPKRFAAFQLYALDGISAAETASRLNMTRTHVYTTRSLVIKRLRELIAERRAEEDKR